jgi:hypothetical protein
MDLLTNITISQEIYHALAKTTPMLSAIYKYAKKENGNLIFKMSFIDSKPTINGKAFN